MYDIPEGRRATRGKSIMNFLSLVEGEQVTSVLAFPKELKGSSRALMMVTRKGVVKKVAAESFNDVRRSGLIAIKLGAGDELHSALFTDKGDSVILATRGGQAIRFKESDVRQMGRAAGGVRAITLKGKDIVVGASVVPKDTAVHYLTVSAGGFGKRTNIREYKIQRRGGSGIKTMKITSKTGEVIAARVVGEGDAELIAISKHGQVIRTRIAEISTLGRQTQGVRIMKLRERDGLASLTFL
jgi:DNA gyrase subunit A